MTEPDHFSVAESDAINRRRRGRNWAIVGALIFVMLMFYAITIVKLSKS
jgi:hypothetical protein